ncbi:uncharacterized protein BDZ99DRAFT_516799 [Mytilinidion resinicola]|uniref:Uncharacterized protein n=1 Tax=Mytilinidion resinicola TaxID=574789 RepID=A0A6A6YZD4_9PEZI|nr:uncharacterized protein BDZ99DRAFT_516799 [Mytilinidion resinicola]KAF2814191.1 hypothetical protein BDZ99DRAFT_516799 [Mytilinidion resinicola]
MAHRYSPSAPPRSPSQPDLTFRISLDFILIGSKPASDLIYEPSDPHRPIYAMRTLLQHLLRPIPSTNPTHDENEDLKALDIQLSPFSLLNLSALNTTAWTLNPHPAATLTPRSTLALPSTWFQTGIRLHSPPLAPADPDFSWREQLHHILHTLHANFDNASPAFPFRLLVNETCDFNVRVSTSDPEDSSERGVVDTVSRVWQLLTGFERLFAQVSAVSRLAGTAQPSAFFRLQDGAKGTRQWCRIIRRAAKDGELGALGREFGWAGERSGRRVGWGFDIRETETGFRGKEMAEVEFGQHRGTLDYADVVAWVDVVAAMVESCAWNTDSVVEELIEKYVGDAGFSPHDLLREIGAQRFTRDHYRWRNSGQDGKNGTAGAERRVQMRRATGEAAEVVRRVETERWLDRRGDRVGKFIGQYERAGGFGEVSEEEDIEEVVSEEGGEEDAEKGEMAAEVEAIWGFLGYDSEGTSHYGM